jgi:hypothetical protein
MPLPPTAVGVTVGTGTSVGVWSGVRVATTVGRAVADARQRGGRA